MDTIPGRCAFLLQPLPYSASGRVRQCHRGSLRKRRAAGAVVYLSFKVDIQPTLERDHYWRAMGFFDLKEDFVAIGLGLLPAYWISWRRPIVNEPGRTAAALTAILAFVVWWGFLIGHVMNNILGFGA
jgi:hypothetical protein